MKLPLQITFRNTPPSAIVEGWIRARAEKLETFYERVVGCHVAVEVPHRHHRNGSPYHIRLELSLPGGAIVVNHVPSLRTWLQQADRRAFRKQLESDCEHKNLHLAISDAFATAARQLRDYARRQRGDVKTHHVRLRRSERGTGRTMFGTIATVPRKQTPDYGSGSKRAELQSACTEICDRVSHACKQI
jgi:ribosome-associated translation inhibitor RaiA